jgi:purine-binding chemotaxis protein CheW
MKGDQQLCTFYLDGHLFGVPVERVQEIIRFQHMTRVPLAPPTICGLINLRGQVVTAIDLRRKLGMAERSTDKQPINVVVRCDDGAVSFLVDEIGDVQAVDESTFEPPLNTLPDQLRQVIHGVFKLQERLLLILDAEKVMETSPC